MKHYHIYVFSQDNCKPCQVLKDYTRTLTPAEQGELDFVPLRTPAGQYTTLAQTLQVMQTPTMVVVHEAWDQYKESMVETVVGARAIMQTLDATIDAYTYAHPPE